MIANYQTVVSDQRDKNRMMQYLQDKLVFTSFERNISSIRAFAFAPCSSLTSISFPNCTIVGDYAFDGCSGITSVSFPKCTSIGSYAFNATGLTSVSFPLCTYVGDQAFCNTHISYINLPNWQGATVSYSTFHEGTLTLSRYLQTILIPKITNLGTSAFERFGQLTTVDLTGVQSVGLSAFQSCSRLTTLSLPNVSVINAWAFAYCSSLSSLYLMGSQVCKLSGYTSMLITRSSFFYRTPIASGTGRVYVPQSLLASYKAASYWKNMSSVILGV